MVSLFTALGDLKGPGNASVDDRKGPQPGNLFSLIKNLPPGGLQVTGDHVEKGCLARAVGTDDPGNRPPLDFDLDAFDGRETAKMFRQAPSCEDGIAPVVFLQDLPQILFPRFLKIASIYHFNPLGRNKTIRRMSR